MTDEPEVPADAEEGDECEDEGYIPESVLIHTDSFLIFDQAEFCDHFNCWGAQLRDGDLFVLDRETYQWRNVEDFGKPAPKNKLKSVQ